MNPTTDNVTSQPLAQGGQGQGQPTSTPAQAQDTRPATNPPNVIRSDANPIEQRPRTTNPTSPSMEKLEDSDTLSWGDNHGLGAANPLPALPPARLVGDGGVFRSRTVDSHHLSPTARRSGIDWIVPVQDDKLTRRHTVGERLQPTLDIAILEKNKYATKAQATGLALNIAIGLQVLLGSLTTGLSAVATTGKQTAVQTTILGGLATLVASYLARARGSNEPELSITRVKDLEHFIRDCQAFQLDYGHILTNEYDQRLERLRTRFEELLGNANGERKLSPV